MSAPDLQGVDWPGLAARLAGESATPAPPPAPGREWELTLRSGVSTLNDNVVGRFSCERTARLCAHFLMSLDQARHPEYVGFSLRSVPAAAPPA